MSDQKEKVYALTLSVKPKSTDNYSKYRAMSFKGISIAENPNDAKEFAISRVLSSYEGYDGSSITKPLITRDSISVKECLLYGDFVAKKTEKTE